jgi:hypothetical protein
MLSLEDDREEIERRLHAVCKLYEIPIAELDGWLFFSCPKKSLKLALMDARRGPQVGELEALVRRKVQELRIDLVGFDPLIKLHSLEENDNSGMDFVAGLLTDLAIELNIGVDTAHHTSKGTVAPGNSEKMRGASAIRDAFRLNYTLTPMTDEEMEKFPDINPEDDRFFVRLDLGKGNPVKRSRLATWFELVDVPLGNGDVINPEGDHVQAIKPFKPQALGSVVTTEIAEAILTRIERGLIDPETGQPTGERYSNHNSAGKRAASLIVCELCPNLDPKAARDMMIRLAP